MDNEGIAYRVKSWHGTPSARTNPDGLRVFGDEF